VDVCLAATQFPTSLLSHEVHCYKVSLHNFNSVSHLKTFRQLLNNLHRRWNSRNIGFEFQTLILP
jgi:hypothetical protein